jgi:hypothetical protein
MTLNEGKHEIVMRDGDGVSLRSGRVFQLRCCDCSLVHDVVIKSGKGGWIGLALRRNKRVTAIRRKHVSKQ